MACIMGPIPQSAIANKPVQVEISYKGENDPGTPRLAFVLEQDGTCRVDLPRLLAFANTSPSPQDGGAYVARAVLATLGHPVAMKPDELQRATKYDLMLSVQQAPSDGGFTAIPTPPHP